MRFPSRGRHRAGRREGLIACRAQRCREGPRSVRQRGVGRQHRRAVATGEPYRSCVAGRGVIERIQRRGIEVERRSRR